MSYGHCGRGCWKKTSYAAVSRRGRVRLLRAATGEVPLADLADEYSVGQIGHSPRHPPQPILTSTDVIGIQSWPDPPRTS